MYGKECCLGFCAILSFWAAFYVGSARRQQAMLAHIVVELSSAYDHIKKSDGRTVDVKCQKPPRNSTAPEGAHTENLIWDIGSRGWSISEIAISICSWSQIPRFRNYSSVSQKISEAKPDLPKETRLEIKTHTQKWDREHISRAGDQADLDGSLAQR